MAIEIFNSQLETCLFQYFFSKWLGLKQSTFGVHASVHASRSVYCDSTQVKNAIGRTSRYFNKREGSLPLRGNTNANHTRARHKVRDHSKFKTSKYKKFRIFSKSNSFSCYRRNFKIFWQPATTWNHWSSPWTPLCLQISAILSISNR